MNSSQSVTCFESDNSKYVSQEPRLRSRGVMLSMKTYIASWWLPTELGEILISLVQYSVLLFKVHFDRVLMRVAMEASAKEFIQPMFLRRRV